MRIFIAAAAAAAALVSTTLVVDLVVVDRVEGQLSREVGCRLDVGTAQVTAEVERWHGLAVLADGSLGDVTVRVDDIGVGDLAGFGPDGRPAARLTASLTLELDDVRRQDGPPQVESGTVEIAIAYDQIRERLRAVTGSDAVTVTGDRDRVVVRAGQSGVQLALAPSIVDDRLHFRVDSMWIGNREVRGAAARALGERLSQRRLADGIDLAGVSDWISLTGVTAAGQALVLAGRIDPDGVPLTAPEHCHG